MGMHGYYIVQAKNRLLLHRYYIIFYIPSFIAKLWERGLVYPKSKGMSHNSNLLGYAHCRRYNMINKLFILLTHVGFAPTLFRCGDDSPRLLLKLHLIIPQNLNIRQDGRIYTRVSLAESMDDRFLCFIPFF